MEHKTTIKYRGGEGPRKNPFTYVVEEIKNKSEKAGTPITDDQIAQELLISREEYIKYLAADSTPREILQFLASKFKNFSTFEVVEFSFESEIEPPPTPDPNEPDDE